MVDDDEAIRDALTEILEDDYKVIAVDSGLGAIDMRKNQVFDLVFLDILMPEFDGIETLRWIKSQEKGPEVIMITAVDRAREACYTTKLGAFDYITKPFDSETILSRVEEMLLKHNFTNETLADSTQRLYKISELSTRELEVLEFVAQGLNNSEIGEKLFISPKTIRNHITHIFDKCLIKSRNKAIVLARGAGFGFKK